jgi:subtilisin family serine protease
MRKTFLVLAAFAATAPATAGQFVKVEGSRAIPYCYIVVLKAGTTVRAGGDKAGLTVAQVAVGAAARYNGRLGHLYEHALSGFSLCMAESAARALAAEPHVELVEQDQIMEANVVQTPVPSWGLDRIDERNLSLDDSYTYNFTGAGVHAYIIDTGIRATHQEFAGRTGNGISFIDNSFDTNDCNGHGTHVSGTVGGTTYGVAKGVTLHPVRVLDCFGFGSTSDVIGGVDWLTNNRIDPAVANMSLGGGASTSLDTAVANSIASGVTYAIAAGNSNANACNSSPARVASALTVGSTTNTDARSSFSNFGTCVDIFAPGSDITSSWNGSDTDTNTISGTSMATPHVAGVAALYLQQFGGFPAAVAIGLINAATTGVVGDPGAGSPNRLLHSLFAGPGSIVTVFADGFDTDTGWIVNPRGTDSATSGTWERGDPEESHDLPIWQLSTCAGGLNCLVTGRLAGAAVGANDVDGGVTSIASPEIDLPSTGTLSLSFAYYLAHKFNATRADFLRVTVVGETSSQVVFEELGTHINDSASYARATANITGFAGQTIRILVEAADAAPDNLLEASIDNLVVVQRP